MLIGVDYHPSFQQIAFLIEETGEYRERRLNHSDGEAEKFYRDLQLRGVRVGMEATGYSRWFDRLLAELGFEVWIGDPAEIKAKRDEMPIPHNATDRDLMPRVPDGFGIETYRTSLVTNKSAKSCVVLKVPYYQANAENLGSGFPGQHEQPDGTINGVNVTFTLPTTQGSVVLVFRNGILQNGGGVDYTLSGVTITFVSAPLTGDTLLVVY